MAESNVQLNLGFDRICETFRITSLHPEQKSCLQVLLEGKDIYASLPTGYGKSMIFFGAPILADYKLSRPRGTSKVLVISPLKSLMENQVALLNSLGLSAIALHEDTTKAVLREEEKGKFTCLFASPEKMLSVSRWRKLLLTEHYRKFLVAIGELRSRLSVLAARF